MPDLMYNGMISRGFLSQCNVGIEFSMLLGPSLLFTDRQIMILRDPFGESLKRLGHPFKGYGFLEVILMLLVKYRNKMESHNPTKYLKLFSPLLDPLSFWAFHSRVSDSRRAIVERCRSRLDWTDF